MRITLNRRSKKRFCIREANFDSVLHEAKFDSALREAKFDSALRESKFDSALHELVAPFVLTCSAAIICGNHTDGHYIILFAEQLTRTFEVLVLLHQSLQELRENPHAHQRLRTCLKARARKKKAFSS